MIFITGCGRFSSSDKGYISDAKVNTGTSGLEMEFIKQSPPDEVFENQIFMAEVLLQNKGASDIKNGKLLIGMEKDYMELLYDRQGFESIDFELEGKSIKNPVGEEKVEGFKIKAKKIDPQTEQHDSTIYVTSCYKYETKASETVCIDVDIHNLVLLEKPCEVKDISLSSQGAPVAITKIEEKMSPSENGDIILPRFTIYLENKGDGEVIDKNSIDKFCSSGPVKSEDINKISIEAYLSGVPLECKFYELKLKDKEDKVICSLKEGIKDDEPAFTTILTIKLSYGYTQTISKEIEIKK